MNQLSGKQLKDLPSLDPTQQHRLPWEVLDKIAGLAILDRSVTHNDLARVCGLPSLRGDGDDFRRRRRVLERLAEFLEDVGIEEGIQELRVTSRGSELTQELNAIGEELRESAGAASAIVRAPSFYFANQSTESSWWSKLTVEVLEEMLAEIGRTDGSGRISVLCNNALNPSPSPGEPYLVREEVHIEARHPEGVFQSLRLLRRIGRQNPTTLTSIEAHQSPFSYVDTHVPNRSTAATYSVEARGATTTSLQVISLAHYEPAGFVTCSGATTRRITRPRRNRVTASWQQQLHLRSDGIKVLRILCGPTVSSVAIVSPAEMKVEPQVIEGIAELQLDLDDDVEIQLELADSDGQLVSTIALSIAIDQTQDETVPSQFYALVRAHQDLKDTISLAKSNESWLRRAERELLTKDSSWSPLLATPGWSSSNPRLADTNILGRLRPQADPRPVVNPPIDFVETRAKVLDWLRRSGAPVPEVNLANDEAKQLAVEYLRSYREWGEHNPEEACWIDTVAILEPEHEQYGNQAFAAHEPIAVLLSPFHPIRFGWHVAAQSALTSGLETPCPLAGLLDPHRCPDVLSLALNRSGGEPRWQPYVSISSQDAMWGLFWDARRLSDMQQHGATVELILAGVVPRGVQSGFTASQAGRTLEEISHVLPTRSTLRIGIIGSGQGSTSCTDGLMTWCRQLYNREGARFANPKSIELYDSRKTDLQPSSEEISSLADDTGHNVRWYSPSFETPTKDLVIIDHLGLASPVSENHTWKSPSTEGSLIRSRIRLDRNDAELVVESRVGNTVRSEDSLLDELTQAIGHVEGAAKDLGGCSHVEFMPNREVISRELQNTRFLAVSSTEIDPACFARSTSRAGGFLWDYELPHAVGPGEQQGGFYLLARPPDAIKRAVQSATELVSQSTIDLDALLVETSRRGIPILKRLAAGGSLARGELGMFLAVRLLQDSFRGLRTKVRLPVCEENILHMVLPVDPYTSPLVKLRQGLSKANPSLRQASRPDLLLACLQINEDRGTPNPIGAFGD